MPPLSGCSEPTLRDCAVRRHVISTAAQHAQREHRANVTLAGGLLEQRHCRDMIAPSAPAVQHHLRQSRFGVGDADRGGARDPGATRLGICLDTTPIDKHAAIPVLRVRYSVSRAAEVLGRLLLVALNTSPVCQTEAIVECRHQIAGRSCLLEPMARLGQVFEMPITYTPQQKIGEIHPGLRIAGVGGDSEPVRRLFRIARHPGASQIKQAKTRSPPLHGWAAATRT